MDLYSVTMPDSVSPELRARADRVEAEIANKGKSTSMVDRHLILTGRDEEQIISLAEGDDEDEEEQMFGTAVPESQKADELTAFESMAADAEKSEYKKIQEEEDVDSCRRVRNPSSLQ